MNIEEVRQMIVERHDMREEIKALKGQVHALRRALTSAVRNIDVSTINRSQRSVRRWEEIITEAEQTLAACPEPKL